MESFVKYDKLTRDQKMNRKELINFSLTTGKYSEFTDQIISMAQKKEPAMVCVANVHMYIEAHKDRSFMQVVNDADVVTPDGTPLTWAMRILYGIRQERVAGMDLLPDLLNVMSQQKIGAYFYGGSEAILSRTREYLAKSYPDLVIAGFHSPPFFSTEDINNGNVDGEVVTAINYSVPSIVFVVLGCPKQEKWMAAMRGKINTVMIGIGGALPVMIGMKKRAPKWMQKYGLEWFFRLVQEPRRLFRRYSITNGLFIWIVLKEYFKIKILRPLGFSKAH